MNWCEAVEEHLKLCYDKAKILISQLETDQSDAILQNMFSSQPISLAMDENVRIAESVQMLMENLRSEITKQDSILTGTLVGVGSFWDGTRVGEVPNEFDSLYALSDVNKNITGCYCGISASLPC